jgi:hypothetical protein
MTYEEIKETIKQSQRRIFWYDSNGQLLVVGPSKTLTRPQIKDYNYEGLIYRLSITFHQTPGGLGNKLGQGGPLAVRCTKFNLEDGKISRIRDKQNGVIWFNKKWLETQMEWDEEYLNIIIIRLKRGETFGFGIKTYE